MEYTKARYVDHYIPKLKKQMLHLTSTIVSDLPSFHQCRDIWDGKPFEDDASLGSYSTLNHAAYMEFASAHLQELFLLYLNSSIDNHKPRKHITEPLAANGPISR